MLIPSFGRGGGTSTDSIISGTLVIPASQESSYANNPGHIELIPDDRDGSVAKKRNACLDLCDPGELVWLIDDDLKRVDWIKHGPVDDVDQLLESHADLMDSIGADFGGFAITADPVRYIEQRPFSLTKPSYGAVCIRNTGLRYDEALSRHEDADYFLQVLHSGGKVIRDNRFFFTFDCNADKQKKQVGGIVGTESDHRAALGLLVKRWGKRIKIKDGKMNGIDTPRRGP